MKIFKGFNEKGPVCPVCNTCDDKPCVLLPIAGSNKGTMNYEAKAIHTDCLDLLYFPADRQYEYDTIIQKVRVNGSQ